MKKFKDVPVGKLFSFKEDTFWKISLISAYVLDNKGFTVGSSQCFDGETVVQ